MKRLVLLLGVLLVAAMLAAPAIATAQATDPAALIHARDAAMNRADIDAALAFYADDATIRDAHPAPGDSGVTRGKDEICGFLAGSLAAKIRLESSNFKPDGATVTFLNHIWFDDPDLIRLNLLPIEGNNTVVIRNGKIQDWLIDLSAEWLARADAAFAADAAAQAGMPKTGGSGFPAEWLVVFGAAGVLCGLALRRRAVVR